MSNDDSSAQRRLRLGTQIGSVVSESAFHAIEQRPLLPLPAESLRRGGEASRLGSAQAFRGAQKFVKTRGKRLGVTGRIEQRSAPCLVRNFLLPGGVAGNDRKTSKEILQNLVRHREIAASTILHLAGKADVVLRDAREQLAGRDGVVNEDKVSPRFRHTLGKPGGEFRRGRTAQMDFGRMAQQRQGGEQIFKASAWTNSLRKPVNCRPPAIRSILE